MITRPQHPRDRIIAALDFPDLSQAEAMAQRLAGEVGLLKVGLELFSTGGRAAFAGVNAQTPVFLDLKLHDIPNTVGSAVAALLAYSPAMLTIHAAGGPAMVAAAREAAERAGAARPMILAVTVLTSIDEVALGATGVAGGMTVQVLRLARLALSAGADGVVCSPLEVAPLRQALGGEPFLVVPGVRPAGSASGDQSRTATPREAVAAGADWIVLGRPITRAANPVAAAQAVAAELA